MQVSIIPGQASISIQFFFAYLCVFETSKSKLKSNKLYDGYNGNDKNKKKIMTRR